MQNEHPVAYLSKALCPKNQALSTYEKECMAILLAVDKWRPYLQLQHFVIRTDHKSLLYLTEQRVHTKLQHKALLKLMDLQFNIVYKQGNTNQADDALSRCPIVSTIFVVSACTPLLIENLIKGYEDDPVASQLLAELALSPHGTKDYTITDGVIRFRGRIWIGNNALASSMCYKLCTLVA